MGRNRLSSESRTYTLIQFVEDGIFYIVPSKKITPIEGKLVWAPYKGMGYYEANIIASHNDRSVLTELRQRRQEGNVIKNQVTEAFDETTYEELGKRNLRHKTDKSIAKNVVVLEKKSCDGNDIKNKVSEAFDEATYKELGKRNLTPKTTDKTIAKNVGPETKSCDGNVIKNKVTEAFEESTYKELGKRNLRHKTTDKSIAKNVVGLEKKSCDGNVIKNKVTDETTYEELGKRNLTHKTIDKSIAKNVGPEETSCDGNVIKNKVIGAFDEATYYKECGERNLTHKATDKSIAKNVVGPKKKSRDGNDVKNKVTKAFDETTYEELSKRNLTYNTTDKSIAKNVVGPEEKSGDGSVIKSKITETFDETTYEELGKGNLTRKTVESISKNVVGLEEESCVKIKKTSHKKHCCYFCKKQVFQVVRHWKHVHCEEDEVQVIMNLHLSNPLRKQKIDKLRRKGDFDFNKSRPSNFKDYIVARKSNYSDTVFIPCPSCLGYFSKNNLRHHKQRCSPNTGSRQLQGNSRKLTYHIHEKASDTLKNIITPDMYHDEVTNHIFFDSILIIYGNYLCIKYTEDHLKNHIRAQLRLLGRFMMRVKTHNPNIKDCKELIHSRNIDIVRKAIDDIAEIDSSVSIYKHPTNARTLLTELKKITQVVKSESDKTEDDVLMKRAKGFSRRIKQELAPYINRVCKNSENRHRRLKQKKYNALPENEEIESYLKYLSKNIYQSKKELGLKFCFSVWKKLTQNLMVYLAAFNRKRPGETQRIEVTDFYNRECVSSKDLAHLDVSEKIQANKYERIGFRGKLGNSTALLIDKVKILPGIKLILKYREAAGVHPSNRFLFAKPSKIENNVTYDAYRCHKQLCNIMGIQHENLTFTKLRKHFATEVSKQGTSQEEERRVSTYMSHDFNIHKKIYDQSAALVDITKVSKYLECTTKGKEYENKKMGVNLGLKRKNFSSSSSDNEVNEKCLVTKQNLTRKRRQRRSETEEEENNFSTDSNGVDDLVVNSKTCLLNNKSSFKKRRKFTSKREEESFTSLDSSDLGDDEPSLEEVENCIGKLQKRRLWTSLEKNTTRRFFEEEIFGNKVVKIDNIVKFKNIYSEMMTHRPISMIKQWIEREKLKVNEKKLGYEGIRPRYSTPEKELLETSLERYSLDGSEPSLVELEELIAKNDILKNRTPDSLLRKFKYITQKRSKHFSNSISH